MRSTRARPAAQRRETLRWTELGLPRCYGKDAVDRPEPRSPGDATHGAKDGQLNRKKAGPVRALVLPREPIEQTALHQGESRRGDPGGRSRHPLAGRRIGARHTGQQPPGVGGRYLGEKARLFSMKRRAWTGGSLASSIQKRQWPPPIVAEASCRLSTSRKRATPSQDRRR